ncbi:uncharacterized protein LOC142908088 [Petromyzon marinus]|uniref:uncharacterized protein LOC142908088 n=1 Tax=Petromyzon marinus TaxID=7757 RepID=UPI003F6FF59F
MTKPQASPKSLKPPEKGEAGVVEWKCECPCADERRDVQRKAQSEEVEPQIQCEKSWDRFNIRPDIDEQESSTRGLRVLRFILLTLLFLAVFGTAVLSKLSLVYLAEMKRVARQAGELDQNQFYSWVLAFVRVLPNIFSSIRCGLRLAFKNSDVSNRMMIALGGVGATTKFRVWQMVPAITIWLPWREIPLSRSSGETKVVGSTSLYFRLIFLKYHLVPCSPRLVFVTTSSRHLSVLPRFELL